MILSNLRLAALILFLALGFGACNSLPDHAKYIPRDAVVVVGLNTQQIGKEIAWSAIAGSKLLDKLRDQMPAKGTMEGLDKAGIKHMSTSYLYVKTDKRYEDGARITAVVPLDDAAKWETYVSRNFDKAVIRQNGDRREATLAEGMYAGWTSDLLIVMNIVRKPSIETSIQIDSSFAAAPADSSVAPDTLAYQPAPKPAPVADTALLASEMASAFTEGSGKGIAGDARFKALETAGHDLTIWVNYDVLMSQNGDRLGMPSELALGATLWKDAAFAAGMDFEKGKIESAMRYYTSEGLKEVAREFGSASVDQELLDRLPSQNLNLIMGCHLSTKGLKGLLEKIGVLGFANLALSSEGLSTDDVFDAFTGDLAMTVNDLNIRYVNQWQAGADSTVVSYNSHSTDLNFVYAMKIANQDKFNKILNYLTAKGMLTVAGNGAYRSPSSDSMFLVTDQRYMVVSNRQEQARAYLEGRYKGQAAITTVKKEVYGHPMGMYVNFQNTLKAIDPRQGSSGADSVALMESRKLLDHLVFSGGSYEKNAFTYKATLSFMDKQEHSLFQLMNFALKLNQAQQKQQEQPQSSPQAGAL